jgi:hypothetical protein
MLKVLKSFASLFLLINLVSGTEKKYKSSVKIDPNDNKGNTPFFLQDPQDQMCLGPNGFTLCNENALWILTKRKGTKTYSMVSLLNPNSNEMCLQRKSNFFGLFVSDKVEVGSCKTGAAKSWSFEFIDSKHVKLSTKSQCLVRGKKKYKNLASLQSCKKGASIALLYHPTAVHEVGFYLKSADSLCFDGNKFKSCETGSNKLLWGIGIRYIWGKAHRYFFNYFDKSQCLVVKGKHVEKGI